MRSYKIFLVSAFFVLFSLPAFSQNINSGQVVSRANNRGNIKPEPVNTKRDDRVGINEIINMASVSFESDNYRLDPDFTLGYGDTVAISLWGKLEGSYKLTIDRDGTVFVPIIGKVSIMGMNLDEARAVVKRELDKKYSNVELDMNLADVRDIRVAVLGNAVTPGSYGVSPFSRVVDVIAKSGGPNEKGSVSDIRLMRDNKEIARFNIYDFVFKGDQSKNLRLKHSDVIFIPQAKNLVAVSGDILYPGRYETDENFKISGVVELAGGILSTVAGRKIHILRIDPKDNVIKPVKTILLEPPKDIAADDDITVQNGDAIIITNAYDYTLYPEDAYKTVAISGQVKLPGIYMITENDTLSSLIKKAGGLKDNAFIEGAVFTRPSLIGKQKPILDELVNAQKKVILEEETRLTEEIIPQQERDMRERSLEYRRKALSIISSRQTKGRIILNLEDVINQKTDIVLMKDDSIAIPPVPDWVMITGAVYNPESVVFSEGKALEYYLNSVGLNKFADRDEIYIIKPSGLVKSKTAGYGNITRGDIIAVPEKV